MSSSISLRGTFNQRLNDALAAKAVQVAQRNLQARQDSRPDLQLGDPNQTAIVMQQNVEDALSDEDGLSDLKKRINAMIGEFFPDRTNAETTELSRFRREILPMLEEVNSVIQKAFPARKVPDEAITVFAREMRNALWEVEQYEFEKIPPMLDQLEEFPGKIDVYHAKVKNGSFEDEIAQLWENEKYKYSLRALFYMYFILKSTHNVLEIAIQEGKKISEVWDRLHQ